MACLMELVPMHGQSPSACWVGRMRARIAQARPAAADNGKTRENVSEMQPLEQASLVQFFRTFLVTAPSFSSIVALFVTD